MEACHQLRPKIKTLRELARRYIPFVTVKWKKMKNHGLADVEKKTIYLNPAIPNRYSGFMFCLEFEESIDSFSFR